MVKTHYLVTTIHPQAPFSRFRFDLRKGLKKIRDFFHRLRGLR